VYDLIFAITLCCKAHLKTLAGECSLENMRTLCVVCHAEVTKAQQTERKLAKRRAKEQLKTVLKELQDRYHMERNESNLDVSNGNIKVFND